MKSNNADRLYSRVADILRRSGVEDAEGLIRELEKRRVKLPTLREAISRMEAGGEDVGAIVVSNSLIRMCEVMNEKSGFPSETMGVRVFGKLHGVPVFTFDRGAFERWAEIQVSRRDHEDITSVTIPILRRPLVIPRDR